MSKDFFDEEYDKMEQEKKEKEAQHENQRQKAMDDWYSYSAREPEGGSAHVKQSSKPWYIALICVTLVAAIALGWVLCAIFGGNGTLSNKKEQQKYVQAAVNAVCDELNKGRAEGDKISLSDQQLEEIYNTLSVTGDSTQLKNEAIISYTFDYLRNAYYQEIDEETWTTAVAAAGTALLQKAGDKFCQIMTPQTYYDFINQTTTTVSANQNLFGMSYTYSTGDVGFKISDVASDGSCYGLLESDDVVLKLTNVSYNESLYQFEGYTFEKLDELVVADYTRDEFITILSVVNTANFRYLRNGDIYDTGVISRGKSGLENSDYNFQFIEFYFVDNRTGEVVTNVSTTNQNKAKHNTYELRQLSSLPRGAGYIRIVGFSYYINDSGKIVSAADEFAKVMKIFQQCGLSRLVLDLKGNPGGLISAVCTIAGHLVTTEKLSDAEKETVTSSLSSNLLISSLVDRDGETTKETVNSSYSDYFDTPGEICDIVVWTDSNSASASELLTGALRDYKTGFQIGDKTYGKGIAQTYATLPYTGTVKTANNTTTTANWAIYYTFAAYYSPLGTNIHGKGYTPDSGYDNITDYSELWTATLKYWG